MQEKSSKVAKKASPCIKKKRERSFLDLDYRFKNNKEEWFAVMLQDGCDPCEDYRMLIYEIEDIFGDDVIYFLPAYIEYLGKKIIGVSLFDGYIFIKREKNVCESLLNRKSEYLNDILAYTLSKKPVTNRDINSLKTKLRHKLKKRVPKVGDDVVALEGTFKNLQGKVLSISVEENTAVVEFQRSTRIVEASLSVINFEVIKEREND